MGEFRANKKPETFIFYRFKFYIHSYLIVDHIKIFKGPKEIGDEIAIIIIIHFERITSGIDQRKFPYHGLGFIISPDIFIVWNNLKIIEMSIKL